MFVHRKLISKTAHVSRVVNQGFSLVERIRAGCWLVEMDG